MRQLAECFTECANQPPVPRAYVCQLQLGNYYRLGLSSWTSRKKKRTRTPHSWPEKCIFFKNECLADQGWAECLGGMYKNKRKDGYV